MNIGGVRHDAAPVPRTGCPVDRSRRNQYPKGVMEVISIKPERKAQLADYARRRGQDVTDALDEALAAYLEWEGADYREAVEGIRQGYEDVKAGARNRPRRCLKSCA